MTIRHLKGLVSRAMDYSEGCNYSQSSMYLQRKVFHSLIEFAKRSRKFELSETTLERFLNDCQRRRKFTQPDYIQRFVRCFRVLQSLEKDENIKLHYRKKLLQIPVQFVQLSNDYSEWLSRKGQCQNTIETKISRLLCFLLYLDSFGISEENIDFDVIFNFKDYIQNKEFSEAYKANILFTLKNFIIFLVDTGTLKPIAQHYVGTIFSHKDARLCSYYSTDEINKTLNQIDRKTKLGKRDYVIVLLFTELGLRESDVLDLKLDDFDWSREELNICMRKTKQPLTLPLTGTLLLALADYIRNARPNADTSLLFPRISPSLKGAYTRGMIYYAVDRYFKRAGINTTDKHHGPHALRHSLTSSLQRQNVSLPTISATLGHGSMNITKRYLWMAPEQLRKLALEVSHEE